MRKMDGDKKEYDHNNGVDDDRAQRMNAADPTAAQALNIKLLEKADPAADQNGIEDGEGDSTPAGARRKPGEHRKDHHRQQNRDQLATVGNRQRNEGKAHRKSRASISAGRMA